MYAAPSTADNTLRVPRGTRARVPACVWVCLRNVHGWRVLIYYMHCTVCKVQIDNTSIIFSRARVCVRLYISHIYGPPIT